MSSLSHLPYGKILDYWHEKLARNRYRYLFLLTKTMEVFAFRSNKFRSRRVASSRSFPDVVPHSVPQNPKVSLVVAAFIGDQTDLKNLERLSLSIQQQTKKVDHLIVVDDCSPLSYSLPDETIRQKMAENAGPAAARNKGIQTALGLNSDIIAFTDVDCILEKNWVQAMVDAYQQYPNFHVLSGNTLSFDRGWLGTYHEINGTLNGRKFIGLDRLLYGVTANLAITATVAEKVRFNEAFREPACEDVEFCFRANEKSFGIRQVPQMIVRHNYGYNSHLFSNLKGFMKLFKKYGKAEKLLLENIPDLYNFFDNTEEISMLSPKSSPM